MSKLKIIGHCREEQLIETLTEINWQKFHGDCESIGRDFNDPQWRFLKAVVFERNVASCSQGKLVYVGNEMKGCDFIVPSLSDLKIEMKYVSNCLYGTAKVPKLKAVCTGITLLNSKGTNKHLNLPDSYADYLMIVDMKGAAIISVHKLRQYVTSNGDSLSAAIPTSELTIVCTPSLCHHEKKELNLKTKIINLIDSVLAMGPSAAGDHTCELCDDQHSATHRCLDCEQDMCQTSLNIHLKARCSLNHRVVPVSEVTATLT